MQKDKPSQPAKVAVIIIGRNESGHLRDCIESVHALDYPQNELEIIYVDSASRDNSPQIAAELGARVIQLSDANGDPMTAARGRNAGWTATQAPWILFLDGDTQVHPQFLNQALAAFAATANEPSPTAAVWGHRRESNPQGSVYNRVLDLDWMYPPGWTTFFGGDVLIRRESLAAVEGYNPELIAGEEPEMCRRLRGLGWRILHIDAPMTLHDLRMTHFTQYWRRATRCGHAYAQVSSMFRGTADPFWTTETRRNLQRGALLLLLFAASIVASIWLRNAWPFLSLMLLILLVSVRSAYKARSRSGSWLTLLLFGLHSHLQEIPIFLGQLRYRLAKASSRKVTLIEYKRA
jgi:cellulose synthase/poly-beta-1,6-N-acetylglucosamine synthase-like glycosyltransferase